MDPDDPSAVFPVGKVPPYADRLRKAAEEMAQDDVVTPADLEGALEDVVGPGIPVGDGAITGQTVAEVTHALGTARRIGRIIGIAAALAMAVYVLVQVAR